MKNLNRFWKPTIGAVALSAVIALAPRGLAEATAAKAKPYPLNTCLVSGEKLDGDMGKPYVFTYKGQEFKLCCPACKKDFDKDPAKYAKQLAEADRKAKEAAVTSGHGAKHSGQTPQKGAERLMQLPRANRHTDVEAARPGEVPGMCCPKCKNMTAAVAEPASQPVHPEETK